MPEACENLMDVKLQMLCIFVWVCVVVARLMEHKHNEHHLSIIIYECWLRYSVYICIRFIHIKYNNNNTIKAYFRSTYYQSCYSLYLHSYHPPSLLPHISIVTSHILLSNIICHIILMIMILPWYIRLYSNVPN